MKPSTFQALINGDFKNAVISETPGGIEQQEKEGQQRIVNNCLLPKEWREEGDKKLLEKIGVKFGKSENELFQRAKLPKGWTFKGSKHDMWSYIYDENGTEVAGIFYKAAFYDERAHGSVNQKYKELLKKNSKEA